MTTSKGGPKFKCMDPSQREMYCSDSREIWALLFLEKKWDFEISLNEPNCDNKERVTTTYAVDSLVKALKIAKRVKATHVRLELGKDQPLKITFKDSEGNETRYWLAPEIEEKK